MPHIFAISASCLFITAMIPRMGAINLRITIGRFAMAMGSSLSNVINSYRFLWCDRHFAAANIASDTASRQYAWGCCENGDVVWGTLFAQVNKMDASRSLNQPLAFSLASILSLNAVHAELPSAWYMHFSFRERGRTIFDFDIIIFKYK